MDEDGKENKSSGEADERRKKQEEDENISYSKAEKKYFQKHFDGNIQWKGFILIFAEPKAMKTHTISNLSMTYNIQNK